MEKGLRDCCRSIRIGKILIQSETALSNPQVRHVSGLKTSKCMVLMENTTQRANSKPSCQ
jgi:hypothetical protein